MTISLQSAAAVLAGGLGIVLVTLGFGVAWTLMRFRAPVRSLRGQFRTARYVFRYDNALEWRGVRLSERRGLTDELRRNIADAAASRDVDDALARLGHPRDLAGNIAARNRGATWAHGSFVALGLWFVFQLATFVGLDVLVTTIEQMAPSNATVMVSPPVLPGVTYEVVTDAAGGVHSTTLETQALFTFLVPMVGFVVFSRPWRALTRRTDAAVAP